MEKVFITNEEKQQLNQLQNDEAEIINQLGQIEYQIQILVSQKEDFKERILKNREMSSNLAKILQDKYGEGNINIETGEFIKA